MIKKTVLFTIALVLSVTAFSQSSMTDEQVAEYYRTEMAKGTNNQKIISDLFGKGVSTDQLRRVRKNFFSGKGVQEESTPSKSEDRTRAQQHTDQFTSSQQTPAKVNGVALYDSAPGDSLEAYINNLEGSKKIFGHDIFNNQSLTFEPNMNMATPANYTLGAGDQVIIDLWGASQKTFTCTVSPDGVIVIDEIGPIKVAGMSVKSAEATIRSRVGQFYSGCNISMSIGNIRTIQVQVVGEVKVPGTYSLSGLATAFYALYSAGGINDIGTLRNIKVYRNSTVIAVIDVYDYLVNGNNRSNVHLQDQDIIYVGPYDCLVNIQGQIKRPMYYEMKKGETVKQILAFAGGYSNDAYTNNVKLTRKSGKEYEIHTIKEFDMGGFELCDGDEIAVDGITPQYSNMIEIRGAVKHAGQYQLGSEIQSVKELLEAADGLREDAYIERAIMHRQKEDLSLEMVSVNLKGIIDGTSPDVPLQKNDLLFIPSRTEMRGNWTYTIKGEVMYPAQYPYAENTTIQDIILQAGGLTNAASLTHVDVFRRVKDNKATSTNHELTKHYTFNIDEEFKPITDSVFYLQPFDEVCIRKTPGFEEAQNVNIIGCVNFTGQYSMTSKDYRLSDLVAASGGVTNQAYIPGAHLTRRLSYEEKILREKAIHQNQVELYEAILNSENSNMTFEKADSLTNLKMNMDDSYPVAIDLEKALAQPKGPYDIVMRKGDVLTIPIYNNIVKVTGEVTYPISMNYKPGEKLKYYINHAGGFANNAKKRAIYIIYANGSVEKAERGSNKLVQPGCQIIVPTKDESRKLSVAETMAIGTSSMSVATMLISLVNLIK